MVAIKMNKYVALYVLSLNLQLAITYLHEKPVAKTIWQENCVRGSSILNDCNWCRCKQSRYSCDARVCSEVDMFGHFNDAIRDLDVGMEGRGVWRNGQSACTPGVHYQRGQLLCICTEDGGWPNPVCRDTFQVLHPVEIVTDVKTFKDQQCTPAKLYLIGCNVCFCPADGVPNPKFCTKKTCLKDDPVYDTPKDEDEANANEIYVQCDLDTKYKLGCKNCICLRNNRLICDNCTNEVTIATQCNKEPGETFNLDCNTCQCDERGMMYCTVKKCIQNEESSKDIIDKVELTLVEPPLSDVDCVPGTKYKKDCNTCYCYERHGVKKFACTLNKCAKSDYSNDCVDGSVYTMNCLICKCDRYDDRKIEICYEDPKCVHDDQGLLNLTNLNGYCRPLHLYKKDCNTCKCLPDGKAVKCSANVCPLDSSSLSNATPDHIEPVSRAHHIPLTVEIVPVVRDIGHCSKGSAFKIDCNFCYCLSNGDVICTTEDCKRY